eukprot:CAMPEP_0117504560 /NCGR_PEP_ID=MMETSP0784-20121206/24912_1 /TAXON_ID=39447 /ORGANISM="" /LENGTH=157 /DNA_ID=CAMNT_0005299919 /DNA_START=81 /DNA_END=551 /DNA_ORIENTATION=-
MDATLKKRKSGAHLGEVEHESHGEAESKPSMPDFDIFPEYLRIGPWSPAALIYLVCFSAWLLWSAGEAFSSTQNWAASVGEPVSDAWAIRSCLAVYCIGINVLTVKWYGPFPFASYTILAYMLLTLRLVADTLGLHTIAELVRFPALVMALVTTTVW